MTCLEKKEHKCLKSLQSILILHFTLSLQSAFYTQSAFYPWSAVCSLQSAFYTDRIPRKTDRFLAKFALKITTKSAVCYRLLFGEVCAENSCEIPAKAADFSKNPVKFDFFLRDLSEALKFRMCFSRGICVQYGGF